MEALPPPKLKEMVFAEATEFVEFLRHDLNVKLQVSLSCFKMLERLVLGSRFDFALNKLLHSEEEKKKMYVWFLRTIKELQTIELDLEPMLTDLEEQKGKMCKWYQIMENENVNVLKAAKLTLENLEKALTWRKFDNVEGTIKEECSSLEYHEGTRSFSPSFCRVKFSISPDYEGFLWRGFEDMREACMFFHGKSHVDLCVLRLFENQESRVLVLNGLVRLNGRLLLKGSEHLFYDGDVLQVQEKVFTFRSARNVDKRFSEAQMIDPSLLNGILKVGFSLHDGKTPTGLNELCDCFPNDESTNKVLRSVYQLLRCSSYSKELKTCPKDERQAGCLLPSLLELNWLLFRHVRPGIGSVWEQALAQAAPFFVFAIVAHDDKIAGILREVAEQSYEFITIESPRGEYPYIDIGDKKENYLKHLKYSIENIEKQGSIRKDFAAFYVLDQMLSKDSSVKLEKRVLEEKYSRWWIVGDKVEVSVNGFKAPQMRFPLFSGMEIRFANTLVYFQDQNEFQIAPLSSSDRTDIENLAHLGEMCSKLVSADMDFKMTISSVVSDDSDKLCNMLKFGSDDLEWHQAWYKAVCCLPMNINSWDVNFVEKEGLGNTRKPNKFCAVFSENIEDSEWNIMKGRIEQEGGSDVMWGDGLYLEIADISQLNDFKKFSAIVTSLDKQKGVVILPCRICSCRPCFRLEEIHLSLFRDFKDFKLFNNGQNWVCVSCVRKLEQKLSCKFDLQKDKEIFEKFDVKGLDVRVLQWVQETKTFDFTCFQHQPTASGPTQVQLQGIEGIRRYPKFESSRQEELTKMLPILIFSRWRNNYFHKSSILLEKQAEQKRCNFMMIGLAKFILAITSASPKLKKLIENYNKF